MLQAGIVLQARSWHCLQSSVRFQQYGLGQARIARRQCTNVTALGDPSLNVIVTDCLTGVWHTAGVAQLEAEGDPMKLALTQIAVECNHVHSMLPSRHLWGV